MTAPEAGHALAAVMTRAGWKSVGGREGNHVRMQWRDQPDTIVVPLDPGARGYASGLDTALDTLGLISVYGESARRVLDELTDAGVIL